MALNMGAGIRSNHGRALLVIGLLLFDLYLIAWAGVTAWQRPCPTEATSFQSFVTSSGCLASLIEDLVPLPVALGFWGVGLVAWFKTRPGLPVEFFLVGAGVLAAGLLSALGSDPGKRIFYLFLAWLAPLAFHFHHSLLDRPPARLGRLVLSGLYSLAVVWSLALLLPYDIPTLRQSGWLAVLQVGIRLDVALALSLAILLIVRDCRAGRASVAARQHFRLVAFGTFFAFAPLLFLSLLPDTLGAPVYVPYEWTFPWLLLSPLAYAYTLFRRQLAHVENSINHAAIYYLLITLFLAIYLGIAAVLNRLVTDLSGSSRPLIYALVGVGLIMLFVPLYRGLHKLVHWVFYGNEVSYADVVGELTQELALVLAPQKLHHLLTERVSQIMHLFGAMLFLRNDPAGPLSLAAACGFAPEEIAAQQLPTSGRLADYLKQAARPVSRGQIGQALAIATLQPEERALLAQPNITYWLPLLASDGVLQGMLLLGAKQGDKFFTVEDERILTTLAHQAGITAHNVRLAGQVWAGRQELARAHQQLLMVSEQERRQLAHDLHDGVVQQLIGINYQLAESQRLVSQIEAPLDHRFAERLTESLATIRREQLEIVTAVRQLLGELRPAGLDELGLTAALEGYVVRLREEAPKAPQIELDLDPAGVDLPEPIAICLFRTAQEALRNALKHARPEHIQLSLQLSDEAVVLTVRDDGCGFLVPARPGESTEADHFGLVSMAERVAWTGGQLTIHSEPGAGTQIIARVPLKG
ncbi:MAG: sensor histidine kinase [Anaerolineales bacterium]|nr:sensor histidine kinase [Anaerolineales bacterium]